jgi:hypothetical protein
MGDKRGVPMSPPANRGRINLPSMGDRSSLFFCLMPNAAGLLRCMSRQLTPTRRSRQRSDMPVVGGKPDLAG